MSSYSSGYRAQRRGNRLSACVALALIASGAAAADRGSVLFNIERQSLASALQAFAAQSGRDVMFAPNVVANRRTAGISGSYEPSRALEALLADSGLRYDITASGSIVIQSKAGGNKIPRPSDGSAQTSERASDVETLEEVVVRGKMDFTENNSFGATKMGMPLHDTPSTVTAITEDLMEVSSIRKFADTYKLDASGGTDHADDGWQRIYLRGFSIQSVNAIRIDGFRFAAPVDLDLAGYDRIEIIKGGVSTLYGQNVVGGMVNAVSKLPEAEAAVRLQAEAGTDSYYRGEADFTGALGGSERWSYRIITAGQNDDTHQDFARNDSYSIVPSLMYRGENSSFILRANYQKQDVSISYGSATRLSGPVPAGLSWQDAVRQGLLDLELIDVPREQWFGSPWNYDKKDGLITQAQYEYVFESGWKLRANLQYSDTRDRRNHYRVLGPFDDAGRSSYEMTYAWDLTYKMYSSEMNLFGDFAAFGRNHTLFFGVDYAENRVTDFEAYTGHDDTLYNVNSPNYGAIVDIPLDDRGNNAYIERENFFGITVQTVLRPLDRVSLMLGGRLNSDASGSFYSDELPTMADARRLAESGMTIDLENYTHFVKQGALSFEINDALNAYVSYGESFHPVADVQFVEGDPDGDLIEPEEGASYEVGLKADFGSDWNFSVALFRMNRDIVIGDLEHPGFVINAGEQESAGIEAALQGRLLPGLNVYASVSRIDAEYVAGPNKGVRSALGPELGLSVYGSYEVLGGPLRGFGVSAGVVHKGGRKGGDAFGQDLVLESTGKPYELDYGDFTEVDARVFYGADQWTVYLAGTNLFDEKYYSPSFDSLTILHTVNPGRLVRVGATLKF